MAGETDLSELITGMVPKLNKGEYVVCSVNDINKIERSVTIREVKEVEGSTVLELNKADELKLKYDYVAAWITLTVHSSLEAVGLTAAFSTAFANNKISCNVIAGYYHDHIFVAIDKSEKAMKVLRELSGVGNVEIIPCKLALKLILTL